MKDDFPKIYKKQIDKIRSKVQNEYYYHASNKELKQEESIGNDYSNVNVIEKLKRIFKRNDYIYQADVIIKLRSGKEKEEKIIGFKDNYIITINKEKIYISDILDIK